MIWKAIQFVQLIALYVVIWTTLYGPGFAKLAERALSEWRWHFVFGGSVACITSVTILLICLGIYGPRKLRLGSRPVRGILLLSFSAALFFSSAAHIVQDFF